VIGTRDSPPEWQAFERAWGSPSGYQTLARRAAYAVVRRLGALRLQARALGPFGFQPDNNATRRFEYPWAFHAVAVEPGHVCIDLGGSLGGLQFVLSKQGARVVNIDPSEQAPMGWPLDQDTFAALNRAFGTSVELRRTFLQDAGVPDSSVDRLYCISTLEHVPDGDRLRLAAEMGASSDRVDT